MKVGNRVVGNFEILRTKCVSDAKRWSIRGRARHSSGADNTKTHKSRQIQIKSYERSSDYRDRKNRKDFLRTHTYLEPLPKVQMLVTLLTSI